MTESNDVKSCARLEQYGIYRFWPSFQWITWSWSKNRQTDRQFDWEKTEARERMRKEKRGREWARHTEVLVCTNFVSTHEFCYTDLGIQKFLTTREKRPSNSNLWIREFLWIRECFKSNGSTNSNSSMPFRGVTCHDCRSPTTAEMSFTTPNQFDRIWSAHSIPSHNVAQDWELVAWTVSP